MYVCMCVYCVVIFTHEHCYGHQWKYSPGPCKTSIALFISNCCYAITLMSCKYSNVCAIDYITPSTISGLIVMYVFIQYP